MAAPAELTHADEALKTLVARFREAPDSPLFIELAGALLARGHATEALRIADHGLQIFPESVEGRIERAAALLGLGRPRVAYLELRRVLAIDPRNRRAMRLLGRAFVDAGAPNRAAELLSRRMQDAPEASTTLEAAPHSNASVATESRPSEPPPSLYPGDSDPPKSAYGLPSNFFTELTKDLGLGASPAAKPPRVEVTQVIRRKAVPRPPRSPSELARVVGPIVDSTQKSVSEVASTPTSEGSTRSPLPELGKDPPEITARERMPLFQGRAENLEDNDEVPTLEPATFAVKPVSLESLEAEPATESRANAAPQPSRSDQGEEKNAERSIRSAGTHAPSGETGADPRLDLDEESRILSASRPGRVEQAAPDSDARAARVEQAHALSRKSRHRIQRPLELAAVAPNPKHVRLALAAALLFGIYVAALVWVYSESLAVWTGLSPPVASEASNTPKKVR